MDGKYSSDRSMEIDLLSDGDGLDVRAKVEPQGEEARQRLKDVAVTVLYGEAVVAHHFWQNLQMGLVLAQRNPARPPRLKQYRGGTLGQGDEAFIQFPCTIC